MKIVKESFKELFQIIKNIKGKKTFATRVVFLITFVSILVLLSVLLPKISFTGSIDLANPNNVAELQPTTDYDQRNQGLIALFIVFAILGVGIGRWQGFGSIIGLLMSGFTIYWIIVPLLLKGWNPTAVTLIGGTLVITGSVFFSHGFKLKTLVAVMGGLISLVCTLILGLVFQKWMMVSGYHGEATYNLLVNTQLNFDMGGIVISGIILAGVGLLDDMTITQASVIQEMILENPKLTVKEIYIKAMRVGKDHAGAVINSLFWAYAAASLPLLMMMNFIDVDLVQVTKYDFFMEEILRTFVSSSGLLLAIPVTSIIGAFVMKKYSHLLDKEDGGHGHKH